MTSSRQLAGVMLIFDEMVATRGSALSATNVVTQLLAVVGFIDLEFGRNNLSEMASTRRHRF